MKKLIAAIICLVALTSHAYPQASGASLQSQINTSWPDNTSQLITPLALRTVVTDIVKSVLTNSGCPSELLGFAADGITPQCYSASVFPSSQTSTVIGNFSGSTQIASSQNVPFCASDGAHALTNPGGSGFNCMGISGAVANGIPWLSPLNYNAAGIIQTTNGAIAASSNQLTVGSISGWTNGAGIWVLGAGSGTADLITTINGAPSGNTITLSANAGTTVNNAVVGPTGAITSGHNSLTISNPVGWSSGEGIDVKGAGSGGLDLITTVSVVSGSTFTLGTNAATTVTNGIVNHDDTAAISAAVNAAMAINGAVYLPAGNYNVTSGIATVTTPMSLFGDGRYVTTIWNRGATNQVFTYNYASTSRLQEYNSGAMIRDFSVNQAGDVTPTAGGAFMFESPSPSNNLLNGLSMRNMFFYMLFNALNIQPTLDANTFEDIVIDNQLGSNAATGSYGIIYNNPAPGGDNWMNNINLTNAGIYISAADANTWSNIKITGGSGPGGPGGAGFNNILFAGTGTGQSSNIQDQRFVNVFVENTLGPCSIDFGTNGISNTYFVGGGQGAIVGALCNTPAVVPQQVGFVGWQWNLGTKVQSNQNGTQYSNYVNAFGDQTSNIFLGTAYNGVAQSDPGTNADVWQVIAPSTTAGSFNHFLYSGWNGGGHRVGALDAAGNNYDHSIAQNWPCAGTCTVGNIEILTTSGQIADAATSTTDGGVGIMLGSSLNIAGDGTNAVAAIGQATCNFDAGSTTPGDFVSYSTTTPGDCHDAGASRPSHGIGRVRFNSVVNVLPF